MSDFDFDEIDKAVTSALTPDTPTPDAPSEFRNEDTPAANTASATPAEATDTPVVPVKSAPAARRSSGRFMDVVHPSSDMRSQTSSFTPPSRPVQEVAKPSETDSTNDALEFEDLPGQPLDSPFLPDAKVEKRPLGAFSETVTNPADTDTLLPPLEDELLLEAPDEPLIEAHALPDPIDFATQATAVSSEDEDTGTLTSETEEEAAAIVEEEPVTAEEVAEPEAAPTEALSPKQLDDEPVGPTSISQQYTEQPSSAPSSGAIYDTEAYHAPLAPAPKKKSGVWTFVWILLLVILGAGAGVAFYLYVLPMF